MPISEGSEEIEAVAIIDTLRRASLTVTVAKVGNNNLTTTMSRNVILDADCLFDKHLISSSTFDALVLPGGLKGAENFVNNELLISYVK